MPRLTSRTASITAAAVVAAGMLAAPAHADFIVTSTRAPSSTDATKDVIRFSALNNGANGSGTALQTMQVDLSSIGAPLVFNFQDLDLDGVNDANILGVGISNLSLNPAGSYIRLGNNPGNPNLTVAARRPENLSDPDGNGVPNSNPTAVYTNRNTFGADMAFTASPPDATTPQVFATAVVPTGTPVQVVTRLFGNTGGGFNVTASNGGAGIPEPASAGLLGLAGLGLLARRRRA
jgi:hypothetical protein